MLQNFNRNVAQLIMGLGAPICLSLDSWEDLLLYLKDQSVITFGINSVGIHHTVVNDFAIVFEEETQFLNQTRIHEFKRDMVIPEDFASTIAKELSYFGYVKGQLFESVTADNFFDED